MKNVQALKLFAAVFVIVYMFLISLAIVEGIHAKTCLENGFEAVKVTLDYTAYCVKRENATSVVVPVKNMEVYNE